MMRASANELDAIELHVLAGQIPAELIGHLYLVAPVGSVSSNGLPNPDNSHVWNGNGLIYRFDLHPSGPIQLTTRLAKTPCYWADLATRQGTTKYTFRFSDWGMARFSLTLGMRNQLNTAFVPIRFGSEDSTRLLLTFDGGRPYEIDPVSLEVVTPIGGNTEWEPGAKTSFPFPPVLSTAHPVFDPLSNLLFTVNYGRSVENLLATIPFLTSLSRSAKSLAKMIGPLALMAQGLLNRLLSWIDHGTGADDFVHVLAWDGKGPLRRWKLINDNGDPICIKQTIHQIGVSQDYLVLADTSLKFGMEQLLPGPFSFGHQLNRLLRKLLTKPQRADTKIYIVQKSDLSDKRTSVTVRTVTLPLETGHFLVDLENPNGLITLHAAHEAATDVSEWVRTEDISPFDSKPIDPDLCGMIAVGAMDVGRVGRYVINATTGQIVDQNLLHDPQATWGIGLYAYRTNGQDGTAHEKCLSTLYWQSLGFWPDLLSNFIYNLYANYPNRIVPLNAILGEKTSVGMRPSTLFRVDTTTMSIIDSYSFPQEQLADGSWQAWICGSPQFVPRTQKADIKGASTENPAIDGWIFCVAICEQSKELWIFDASHLAVGPICRLGHPQFDPGYTIHTTWLEVIQPRQAPYSIGVREDYDPLLRNSPQAVRDLFNQEIYPEFLNN
jgi:hypothetical protein